MASYVNNIYCKICKKKKNQPIYVTDVTDKVINTNLRIKLKCSWFGWYQVSFKPRCW